jgi:hypothetical protein
MSRARAYARRQTGFLAGLEPAALADPDPPDLDAGLEDEAPDDSDEADGARPLLAEVGAILAASGAAYVATTDGVRASLFCPPPDRRGPDFVVWSETGANALIFCPDDSGPGLARAMRAWQDTFGDGFEAAVVSYPPDPMLPRLWYETLDGRRRPFAEWLDGAAG